MLVDKITLKDIGLFDSEDQKGLITHLNFCKTNGGKEQFEKYLRQPLNSIESIQSRQKVVTEFMNKIHFIQQMKITNGTTLVIEKFFSTAFKSIPTQISIPGAYWYQYINASDYTLLKYSIGHILIFYENLNQWVSVFSTIKENTEINTLVNEIKKYTQHPELAKINALQVLAHPQKLLSLAYFLKNYYKNNTLQLLDHFYTLDAYYSMASAALQYHFVFPHWIQSNSPSIEVLSATHPLIPNAIENTISLTLNSNLLFLTGANMAGKSTFIKTVGITVYLAHIGMGTPAKKINLTLFDGLITNLTIADNIVKGESYFFNEVQRIKNTIEKIRDGKKYFVLIDELFKGTNIQDAMKCSVVVIEGLQKLNTSLFIISTHLYEISEELKKYENIQFNYFETEVRQKELIFHYQLKQGVSQDRLGYLILEREGVVDMLKKLSSKQY